MDNKEKFHGNLSVLLKVIIILVLRIDLRVPCGFWVPCSKSLSGFAGF